MWFVAVVLAGLGPEAAVAPVGPPVPAPSFMYHPDVASDGDGGFFAVWADKRFTGGDSAIIGTRVWPDGGLADPRGFTISQLFGTMPKVRFLGGRWVVVWSHYGETWLRAFSPAGVFAGPAQRVGPGECPDFEPTPDGGLVVVSGGGWQGGFLRRYGPALSPIDAQSVPFSTESVSCPRIEGPFVLFDAPHPDGGRGTGLVGLGADGLPLSESRLSDVQPLSSPRLVGRPSTAPGGFIGLSSSNELVATTVTGMRSLVFSTPTVPGDAELVVQADGGFAALALTSAGTALFHASALSGPWSSPTLVTGLTGFQLSLARGPSSALALSTGGEAQWFDDSLAARGAALQVATPFTYHQAPVVSVGAGTSLTVWREPSVPFSSIRATFPGQAPFSVASAMDPGGRDCPAVAFDGTRFGVAWRNDDDIEFRTVELSGALGPTLTLELQASTCPALVVSQGSFQLARGRQNEVVVAGFFPDGGARNGWSVSTTVRPESVSVTLDDGGDGYVVWNERPANEESRVRAARKSGAAISSFLVCQTGSCEDPKVVPDGLGGAIVVSNTFMSGLVAQRLIGGAVSPPVGLRSQLRFHAVAPVPEGALVTASDLQTGELLLWQVSVAGPSLDAGAPLQVVPPGEFALRPSLASTPFTLVTLEPDVTRSVPQAFRRVWAPNGPDAGCLGGWACGSGACVAGRCVLDGGSTPLDAGVLMTDGGALVDGGLLMPPDAGSVDGGDAGNDDGGLLLPPDAGSVDGGDAGNDDGGLLLPPDAGFVDGGDAGPGPLDGGAGAPGQDIDAGPPLGTNPGTGEPTAPGSFRLGCDCQSGSGTSALAGLALLGLVRRRSRARGNA
ncbi:MAG: MYXO-CTERM sorting domain-containing protein [Myxococcaceae bacterium]|nr:MYXO-CTERM sorting domain-containing protein [Myxococcaceae bacterium]